MQTAVGNSSLLTLSVESDINGFQNKQLLDEAEHDINDDI